MRISVDSYADLVAQLASRSPKVSPRGKNRTKKQTEGWVAHRLIPTLAKLQLLTFPLDVEDRDRPDLRISSGGREIGIELTEMIPPVYCLSWNMTAPLPC